QVAEGVVVVIGLLLELGREHQRADQRARAVEVAGLVDDREHTRETLGRLAEAGPRSSVAQAPLQGRDELALRWVIGWIGAQPSWIAAHGDRLQGLGSGDRVLGSTPKDLGVGVDQRLGKRRELA